MKIIPKKLDFAKSFRFSPANLKLVVNKNLITGFLYIY